MFDLANQSFTLLINTLFFSIYVRTVVAETEESGDRLWGALFSGSMLGVVVLSPFVGAAADARAWKRELLIGSGLACAGLTCLLGVVPPSWMGLLIVLYVSANVAFNLGENLLASFLPQIATPGTMGRVSAIGWTMGFAGALVLLLLSGGLILAFGWRDPAQWRPLFVFAGLWFLLASIPTILILRERARPSAAATDLGIARLAIRRLTGTARDARRFRHLLWFLAIFLIYSTGTLTVVAFAGVLASGTFKFGTAKLVLFILQLTVTAGLGAVLVALVQDRIGSQRTVMIFLAVFAMSTVALAFMPRAAATGEPPPMEWLFWVLANGVGFGLGGIGTSSRALVGVMTPLHKTAEFFGLWGMVYKGSGVLGPFAFGLIKSGLGDTPALLALAGVFAGGFLLMLTVDERRGQRAARDAEAEADPGQITSEDLAAAATLPVEERSAHAPPPGGISAEPSDQRIVGHDPNPRPPPG